MVLSGWSPAKQPSKHELSLNSIHLNAMLTATPTGTVPSNNASCLHVPFTGDPYSALQMPPTTSHSLSITELGVEPGLGAPCHWFSLQHQRPSVPWVLVGK